MLSENPEGLDGWLLVMVKIEVLLINMYVEVNELQTMLLATNLILDNLASTVVLGSLPLQPEENHDEDYRREGHEDFLAVRITEYAHKSEYILFFLISAIQFFQQRIQIWTAISTEGHNI